MFPNIGQQYHCSPYNNYFNSNNQANQPTLQAPSNQCTNCPEIVGEGDVTSVICPDGSIQFYFHPTVQHCRPTLCNPFAGNNSNQGINSGPWFIKSVSNPLPLSLFTQNCRRPTSPTLPYINLDNTNNTYNNNNNSTPTPFQLQFHNDSGTSTSDLHYFYPHLKTTQGFKSGTAINTSPLCVDEKNKMDTNLQMSQPFSQEFTVLPCSCSSKGTPCAGKSTLANMSNYLPTLPMSGSDSNCVYATGSTGVPGQKVSKTKCKHAPKKKKGQCQPPSRASSTGSMKLSKKSSGKISCKSSKSCATPPPSNCYYRNQPSSITRFYKYLTTPKCPASKSIFDSIIGKFQALAYYLPGFGSCPKDKGEKKCKNAKSKDCGSCSSSGSCTSCSSAKSSTKCKKKKKKNDGGCPFAPTSVSGQIISIGSAISQLSSSGLSSLRCSGIGKTVLGQGLCCPAGNAPSCPSSKSSCGSKKSKCSAHKAKCCAEVCDPEKGCKKDIPPQHECCTKGSKTKKPVECECFLPPPKQECCTKGSKTKKPVECECFLPPTKQEYCTKGSKKSLENIYCEPVMKECPSKESNNSVEIIICSEPSKPTKACKKHRKNTGEVCCVTKTVSKTKKKCCKKDSKKSCNCEPNVKQCSLKDSQSSVEIICPKTFKSKKKCRKEDSTVDHYVCEPVIKDCSSNGSQCSLEIICTKTSKPRKKCFKKGSKEEYSKNSQTSVESICSKTSKPKKKCCKKGSKAEQVCCQPVIKECSSKDSQTSIESISFKPIKPKKKCCKKRSKVEHTCCQPGIKESSNYSLSSVESSFCSNPIESKETSCCKHHSKKSEDVCCVRSKTKKKCCNKHRKSSQEHYEPSRPQRTCCSKHSQQSEELHYVPSKPKHKCCRKHYSSPSDSETSEDSYCPLSRRHQHSCCKHNKRPIEYVYFEPPKHKKLCCKKHARHPADTDCSEASKPVCYKYVRKTSTPCIDIDSDNPCKVMVSKKTSPRAIPTDTSCKYVTTFADTGTDCIDVEQKTQTDKERNSTTCQYLEDLDNMLSSMSRLESLLNCATTSSNSTCSWVKDKLKRMKNDLVTDPCETKTAHSDHAICDEKPKVRRPSCCSLNSENKTNINKNEKRPSCCSLKSENKTNIKGNEKSPRTSCSSLNLENKTNTKAIEKSPRPSCSSLNLENKTK